MFTGWKGLQGEEVWQTCQLHTTLPCFLNLHRPNLTQMDNFWRIKSASRRLVQVAPVASWREVGVDIPVREAVQKKSQRWKVWESMFQWVPFFTSRSQVRAKAMWWPTSDSPKDSEMVTLAVPHQFRCEAMEKPVVQFLPSSCQIRTIYLTNRDKNEVPSLQKHLGTSIKKDSFNVRRIILYLSKAHHIAGVLTLRMACKIKVFWTVAMGTYQLDQSVGRSTIQN